jgi:hypothetical protein
MPYQTNFFDMLLKQSGFWSGYYGSVQDKKNFAEWIFNDCPKEFKPYCEKSDRDFLPSKEKIDKKIQDLIEENPSLKFNRNIDDWKAVIEHFHRLLLHNYKERYLNTYVDNWKREDDMQKWMQREIDQHLVQNKPSFTSGREVTIGGGNCDHYYKNIPICDKWKRDSNASSFPIKIFDFVDKVYENHKAQFFSYVQDVKLGVIVIVDSSMQYLFFKYWIKLLLRVISAFLNCSIKNAYYSPYCKFFCKQFCEVCINYCISQEFNLYYISFYPPIQPFFQDYTYLLRYNIQ